METEDAISLLEELIDTYLQCATVIKHVYSGNLTPNYELVRTKARDYREALTVLKNAIKEQS